jgi:hypothetical protein
MTRGVVTLQTSSWSEPRDFSQDVKGDDFVKTRTIQVQQSSDKIQYTLMRSRQATTSETLIVEKSAGLEVGVESVTEVGVQGTGQLEGLGALKAETKETIKVNAKGTFGVKINDQKSVTLTDGSGMTVAFEGRKITADAPSIKPLL